MAKNTPQILKGFRDFLPEKMRVRREVIKRLTSVFKKYGYDEIQSPALEYEKVLLGKYGTEAEKLMYLFEDQGKRKIGLRYDLTVPLARIMATNRDLATPFKRYQIQPVYRAEKPQRGRYRELYQCDVDLIGPSSPMADAEILAIINDSLTSLEFSNFQIRVNSRQVLNTIMESAKVSNDKRLKCIGILDKLEKKGESEVKKELTENSLSKLQIESIFSGIKKALPDEFLKKTLDYAQKMGVNKNIVFDPTLARGLDYYTGPIYESVVNQNPPAGRQVGSITGGGRYDKLLSDLGGPDLPATGTSFGLDRICDAIEDFNLWKNLGKTNIKTLVTIFSDKLVDSSLDVVALLRKSSIETELYPDEKVNLKKQLKYADQKNIPWAVIVGPNEVLKRSVVLKNLKTKTQETIPVNALLTKIK